LRTVAAGIAAGQNVVPTAVMAVDDRGSHVFVLDNDLGATLNGTVSVLDAVSGRLVRRIVVGPEPTGVSVDERTGRAVVLNQGGVVAADDPWSWMPGALRRSLPFIPPRRSATRAVPASVSIVDLGRRVVPE